MFYYISFLRPPPLVASPTSESVLITPQICNDLRTEFLNDPIDIYYAWSLHDPTPAEPTTTTPLKLTSWRPDAAYKEIPVPRPPPLDGRIHTSQTPDGRLWRLILSCGTTHDDRLITLGDTDAIGTSPFAVSSLPVRFPPRVTHSPANKRAAKGAKQEHIARSYALRVPLHDRARDRPAVFAITEQTSFALDKKVWDSGIGLSAWLARLFAGKGAEAEAEGARAELRASLFGTGSRQILELGAGTGIVAITLAVLRATCDLSDQPGSIVTTDLPSAMPILQGNISANRALMGECVPQAAVLDWEREDFPEPVQAQLEAGLDVIVMADVTYNTASFPALTGTLSRLIHMCKQRRNGRPPRIVMGYKERHPDERTLWDRAKEIGIHFHQIARINGLGGNPVEIWIG